MKFENMKYVIGRRRNNLGEIEFIGEVFPSLYRYHQDTFNELKKQYPNLKFVGAAYCDMDSDLKEIKVHGKSEGFQTEANPWDQEILTKLFKEDKLIFY